MRAIKFHVHQGQDGQFYANMKAGNGEIIWQSEGYKQEANAHKVCLRTTEIMEYTFCQRVVRLFVGVKVNYTADSLKP